MGLECTLVALVSGCIAGNTLDTQSILFLFNNLVGRLELLRPRRSPRPLNRHLSSPRETREAQLGCPLRLIESIEPTSHPRCAQTNPQRIAARAITLTRTTFILLLQVRVLC